MAKRPSAQAAVTVSAYQQVPVSDLTGGLDLRQDQSLLPTEKSRTLLNWSLGIPGALQVRAGFRAITALFTDTSMAQHLLFGTGPIQGGRRIYLNTNLPTLNSTAFTLVAQNGQIATVSDANSTSVLIVAGSYSTSANIFFLHDRDIVAAMDGVRIPAKSSNSTSVWTQLGISASTTAPTLNSTTGGSLSSGSMFEVSYSFKDRDLAAESNGGSTASITLTSTGAIRVVATNSTNTSIDAIVLYARNVTAGETVRRRASSGPVSTAATSTLTITSSNWTSNDEVPTDHDVAPVLAFGVVWKNRWWAASGTIGNRLHFTQLFQPQSWPTLFYIDIPFDLGDIIRSIDAIGDTLIIHGATKAFVILGQTSLDFEVRPALGSQEGSLGPFATTKVESSLIHAGASGIYSFDGASDRLLTRELEPAWRDLVKNADPAALGRTAVTYDALQKEIRVAVPRRFPSGAPGEFVLDLNRSQEATGETAWTHTDRTIRSYIPWNGPEAIAGDRGRILSCHSSRAQVFEEAYGTTANSSDMVATYDGPGLTLGARKGRWVDLRGEYEPNSGVLTVESIVDGIPQGPRTITLGAGMATYDTSLYDVAVYPGAGRKQWHTNLPMRAEGRTLTQTVVYTGQSAFKHFGYAVGLVPEPTARDFNE